ncbi:type II toxin-antitoxin system HigB family toxin [Arcticibacterium luteifluviistationis]|uniref:Addiction module toxin RelE n=1 Tax=Arcticibacterium luteifluviistationis TaxID=1784714 RepID=A0A2Z4GI60_9BACT|nr:type II toxin-antitoxin system HigB family toxin [Arcticibacterium luteifluviistationis]AWW00669.1 addiction module toxin RelE [Arcticibacterium luteifluviistationis]
MFNIINRRTILHYCTMYLKAKNALLEWYHEVKSAEFESFQELKQSYGSASIVGDDRVVFNLMGNQFRLVVRFVFPFKTVQIKWFGTHKEYDKIDVTTIKFKKK